MVEIEYKDENGEEIVRSFGSNLTPRVGEFYRLDDEEFEIVKVTNVFSFEKVKEWVEVKMVRV